MQYKKMYVSHILNVSLTIAVTQVTISYSEHAFSSVHDQ